MGQGIWPGGLHSCLSLFLFALFLSLPFREREGRPTERRE